MRVLVGFSILWAVVGALVAGSAFFADQGFTSAELLLIVPASVVGPVAALAAARAVSKFRTGIAVTLLFVSLITPTYFYWVVSLIPIILILILIMERQTMRELKRDSRAV